MVEKRTPVVERVRRMITVLFVVLRVSGAPQTEVAARQRAVEVRHRSLPPCNLVVPFFSDCVVERH